MLALLPPFFQAIEHMPGRSVFEPLLPLLPARDMSVPVFASIWGVVALGIWRARKSPHFMLAFAWSFAILTVFRMTTITLTAFETPAGLIPLVDPLANRFYGKTFITRDLFFSGHTATLCLFYCCFEKKADRIITAIGILIVGTGVLIQHVHYTVDVLAAPFLTYFCYSIAKKLAFR